MGVVLRETGNRGEAYVVWYLKNMGWKIIEQNARYPWGEIDIVAVAPDQTLVFVEVKTMKPGNIKPEDQITRAKLSKFKKVGVGYANSHPHLVTEKRGYRFDVAALTETKGEYVVNWYENVC